jgi:hypothetical protein
MSTEYGNTTRGIEAPNYDDLIHGLPLWNEIAPNLFQGGTHGRKRSSLPSNSTRL